MERRLKGLVGYDQPPLMAHHAGIGRRRCKDRIVSFTGNPTFKIPHGSLTNEAKGHSGLWTVAGRSVEPCRKIVALQLGGLSLQPRPPCFVREHASLDLIHPRRAESSARSPAASNIGCPRP